MKFLAAGKILAPARVTGVARVLVGFIFPITKAAQWRTGKKENENFTPLKFAEE